MQRSLMFADLDGRRSDQPPRSAPRAAADPCDRGHRGLGIGATTVIFSGINAALLRPLPYPAPERLVWIYTDAPPNKFRFSLADYLALEEQQTQFEQIAAYTDLAMAFSDGVDAERLRGRVVVVDVPAAPRDQARHGPAVHRCRRPARQSAGSDRQPRVLAKRLGGAPASPARPCGWTGRIIS